LNHKNYSLKNIYYEAFIDIAFLPKKSEIFSDLITMWIGDFQSLMDMIPLNDEGMYVALACHYQVDSPWEECEGEPWKVDDLEVSLSQLLNIKDTLFKKAKDFNSLNNSIEYEKCSKLLQICNDICFLFDKAASGYGQVFIKYYY